MKLFLTFALISLAATLQTQTGIQAGSDLVVLKFTWNKYVTGSGLIHPVEADPAPGPLVINRERTRDPNYQRPAEKPMERGAELEALEREAATSVNRRTDFFVYRLQIKNTGNKPIKSFVWASQDPADATASVQRQFLCLVKTKPNETKALDFLSTLAPSPVVSADKAEDKTEKNSSLSAVINRIEYVDGSIWQRPGWETSNLSQDARPKVESGKCIRL